MTSVIRESNLLAIPDQIASELGLHTGIPVEVTRTSEGFEVKPARPALRPGSDGVWRSHADRVAILEGLMGQGQRLSAKSRIQVDALLQDRTADDHLDFEDEII